MKNVFLSFLVTKTLKYMRKILRKRTLLPNTCVLNFFFHIIRYQNAKRLEKLFIWGNKTTESETCLLNIFEHDGTKALKKEGNLPIWE